MKYFDLERLVRRADAFRQARVARDALEPSTADALVEAFLAVDQELSPLMTELRDGRVRRAVEQLGRAQAAQDATADGAESEAQRALLELRRRRLAEDLLHVIDDDIPF